ncbi:hypothetical protein DRH27_01750 [Candidatus Falkowbacteria bacterium]|nr:MAG: hypothetical protein DRH27_01750 [Candidatus Falkowbacteria bacterium]
MWKNLVKSFIFVLIFNTLFFASPQDWFFTLEARGISAEPINKEYHINLDKPTILKGYTVSSFNNNIKLSLVPGILSEATAVEVIELNEDLDMPWQVDKISRIYQFEFKNKMAYDNHVPFYIQFSYDIPDNKYKQVFFYDKNFSTWRPLPTKDFPKEQFVRSLIHLPFARIAVFSYPEIMTTGRASWYSYKAGNFAASPDFPKGSRLRVKNIENGKFVDVEINDFGPDRGIHPDRVVDLEKTAFNKIASLGDGMAEVEVEPLYIAASDNRTLGINELGAGSGVEINLKSGVIMREDSEEIVWEKNSTSTMPLASLTKMVAVKVFLDTKPTLSTVVSYSLRDEEYNYQHVNKWESASLNIDNGETLTIEDLVYVSLVGSANNTVETLVRASGLARADFINKMNFSVIEWGANNTYFIEPTGLAPENVSSSLDYAIITKEVLKNPIIEKASKTDKYEFYTINTNKFHRIRNTNKIINTNKFNITGSKTGYLDEAGYCLMTRVKAGNGINFIVVTLGADSRDQSFTETSRLIEYGQRKISI